MAAYKTILLLKTLDEYYISYHTILYMHNSCSILLIAFTYTFTDVPWYRFFGFALRLHGELSTCSRLVIISAKMLYLMRTSGHLVNSCQSSS